MHERNDIKVHAENGSDQIQGQKNGGDGRQSSHRLIGAVALRIEVNLHGSFNAVFQAPHMMDHAVDVL